jgi:hypothetical protein
MSSFSTGKYALAISDRSGMAFPYKEMVREWNGSLVHISEFEAKHPQLEPRSHRGDAQSLRNARPARAEPIVANILPGNPFKTSNSGSAVITVTEPNHGRTSSDTVRFRNVPVSFDGINSVDIINASGYTITVVDTNSYSFTVANSTATTGNINGGGGLVSAGPVTLTP